MKKCFFILMVALIAFGALFVSCKNEVQAPSEELVSVSFDKDSSRSLSSNLEKFEPEKYYWKYAAKKADASNLISGQTANYDSDPESGALWIKEGEPGFGVTSGELYIPFKVQGFSQGLWNFRLFGYKKVIGDNPATSAVETEYYLLAYSGETTGVLLKQNGTNLVKAIVSPTQAGNGTLVVKITGSDKITLDPATPGLIPNTKIKLKVEKITSTATTTVFEDFVTEDYDESLEAGTYKVTVKFTNDDASVIFASGSVISTVYANLTTTVKGNLTEVVTYADFGADPNPDIITETIGTDAITQGTSSETVSFTSSSQTSKVTASMPTAAAKSLITEMEQALDAKTSTSTSKTSNLTLNLSVNTTAATETTITYEIGMEATLVYEKKDAQSSEKTTTKSTVERLNKFVTVVIDLQENLQDVAVIHGTNSMTSCTQTEFNNKTESDDPNGIGFFYYDSANGKLYIKTWKFSPFKLTYSVPKYVAAIGSVRYTTLKQALDAVADGDTVLLLEDMNLDITKDDAVSVNGRYVAFLVKAFKNLTIDGNGKTITVRTTDSDIKDVFCLDASGETTGGLNIDNVWNIKNLSINATGFQTVILSNVELNKSHVANIDNVNITTDGEGIYANGEVTVNVRNSALTHSGEYVAGKDEVYYSAVIVGYNGTVNLDGCEIGSFGNAIATFPSGGTITLTDCDVSAIAVDGMDISGNVIWSRNEDYKNNPEYTGSSVITVNSGNYYGAVYVTQKWDSSKANHLYSLANIKGGSFSNFGVTVSHASGCDLAEADHVVITGGTYDVDPSDYVAAGYIADYKTSKWTVRPLGPEDYVASVTHNGVDTPYYSLKAAFDATESGDTVTLLKNTSVGSEISIPSGKTLALVLNGKTITGTEHDKDKAVFRNVGIFTINGSTEGSAINADASAVISEAGSVTVNGGSYSNSYYNDNNHDTDRNNHRGSYVFDITGGTAVIKSITLTQFVKGIRAQGSGTSVTVSDSSAVVTPGPATGDFVGWGWGLFCANDKGTLTIESGNYVTTYTTQQQMIDIKKDGKVIIGGGSFTTIYAGSESQGAPALVVFNSGDTSEGGGDCLTINGGTFTYAGDLGYVNGSNYGDVSITAGTFHVSSLNSTVQTGTKPGYSITGGKFYTDPSAYLVSPYWALYHPATTGETPDAEHWTVETAPSTAIFALIDNTSSEVEYIDSTNFRSITGYGDGPNPGVPANHTLKMLKNCKLTISNANTGYLILFAGDGITFDLNYHKFKIDMTNYQLSICFDNKSPSIKDLTFKNGTIEVLLLPGDDSKYLFWTPNSDGPASDQFRSVGVTYSGITNPWTHGAMTSPYPAQPTT